MLSLSHSEYIKLSVNKKIYDKIIIDRILKNKKMIKYPVSNFSTENIQLKRKSFISNH